MFLFLHFFLLHLISVYKKTVSSIVIGCFAMSVFAQIPNNGFESWTNMGNYNNPDQWATLNAMTNFDSTYTCIQGTPGNPGNSYLLLQSQTVKGLSIVPGIAATGIIDTTNYSVHGGFPFTLRPQNLTGNWQYMAFSGNVGFVAIYLTKWNTVTNTRDTISATITSLAGMAMTWYMFSITLNYQMNSFPDSAQIILSASGIANPTEGDYLYIDNLAFTGSVAGIETNHFLANLKLFPNPSNENLTLEFNIPKAEKLKIQIVAITGQIMKEVSLEIIQGYSKYFFEIKTIEAGTYFLNFITSEGLEVKKLIVE